jgi:hypothetical protein
MSTPKTRAAKKPRRESVKHLKDGIAIAVQRLVEVQDDLQEVSSFLYVCIAALRPRSGDDLNPDIERVSSVAYEKLVLDVNRNIRDVLKALGQDGGK